MTQIVLGLWLLFLSLYIGSYFVQIEETNRIQNLQIFQMQEQLKELEYQIIHLSR